MDQAYKFSKEEVFKNLQTSQKGLTQTQAQDRLKIYGLNKLTSKKKISPLSIFFEQFKNILILILIVAAFLILFIYFFGEKDNSDLIEAGLIFAIVLMIAILGFIQEYKAEKAIESLKKLLAYKTKVKRDNTEVEINVEALVPGDIVILEEGTKVPADIRLLESYSLQTSEASLTGESTPVFKHSNQIIEDKQIADQKNMVFSGTVISSGRGLGVVIATGDKTEIGKIATLITEAKEEPTPIQIRLDQIGKMLGIGVIIICVFVFIFIVFFAQDYSSQSLLQRIIHSFIASVALAVAAIPEGLPAVVTISLALGTQRMLKKNSLVRKLNSVETLGCVDTICADKTGTLTKGEMTVTQIYFDRKDYFISGTGYETKGEFLNEGKKIDPRSLELILNAGLQCNNSTLTPDGKILGDPTEGSLIVSAYKTNLKTKLERVHEIPFSSERKMMSVVVKMADKLLLFTKGAPEVVLSKCTKTQGNKQLNKNINQDILEKTHQMSTKALRTLGFAYKEIREEEIKNPETLEKDLIFLGLQGMIDPPRIEIKPVIVKCQESGIRIIMITGDHKDTALAVAREIGILGDSLSGEELDKLSPEELSKIVDKVSIYARVNPGSKMKIIECLKSKGLIVAMTGDGVNDAPALKKADIGVAMGITGTDVAKEASDMVLLDDHFNTIVSAIEEGRGIFHNIKKFVNYLLSCNIGEVFVVFAALMFFKELPLSASMLLWINVVTDGLPALALGLDPAEKGIMKYKPKLFQGEIINFKSWVKMIIFGILLAFGVLGIFNLNLVEGFQEAKGAAFCAIVVFELVMIYIIRSSYKVGIFSNLYLILAVLLTLGLQVLIVYIPFLANLFEVKGIDLIDWVYIFVASIILGAILKFVQVIFDNLNFKNTAIVSA